MSGMIFDCDPPGDRLARQLKAELAEANRLVDKYRRDLAYAQANIALRERELRRAANEIARLHEVIRDVASVYDRSDVAP